LAKRGYAARNKLVVLEESALERAK
jgi:hypothetical protein